MTAAQSAPSVRALPLDEQIDGVRKSARACREKYGRVHLQCASDNPIVLAGVTGIDGVPIHVEDGIVLADTTGSGKPDVPVAGALFLIQSECSLSDSKGRCSEDPEHGDGCEDDGWGWGGADDDD